MCTDRGKRTHLSTVFKYIFEERREKRTTTKIVSAIAVSSVYRAIVREMGPFLQTRIDRNICQSTDQNMMLSISKKLDLLMIKIENLTSEQAKINLNMNNANLLINSCHKEINLMKEFIMHKVCPFVCELSDSFLGKNKQAEKDRLRPLLIQLKQDIDETNKSNVTNPRATATLSNSSSNESLSNSV